MKLICLLIICCAQFVFAQTTKPDQKRAIDVYLEEQRVSNGGIKIKKAFFDLDIEEMRAHYHMLVDEAMTLEEFNNFWPRVKRDVLPEEEFEQLMIGMTAEFQDGHHNTMRKSTHHWDLGLKTATIQGRLYVTGTNPKTYTPGRFGRPLLIGDEIVAIDGKSVHELKKEFLLYTRMLGGSYESQEAMALESIVSRSGRYLRSVKEGDSVTVTLRRMTQTGPVDFEGDLVWVDASKLSSEIQFYAGLNPRAPKNFTAPKYHFGMMSQRMSQFRVGVDSLGLPNGAITEIGDLVNVDFQREISKIPVQRRAGIPVGPIGRLQAYTVQLAPSVKAGVIRIPSYSPSGGFLQVIREFNWIAECIDRMNNSGVTYYVVDAAGNGGGYVDYVAHLMRFFAFSGDLKTGSANVRLTKTYLNMLKQASVEGIGPSLLTEFGAEAAQVLTDMTSLEQISMEIGQQIKLKNYFSAVQDTFADKNQLRLLYKDYKARYDAGEKWGGQRPYMGTVNGITEGKQGISARTMNPIFMKPVIFHNDTRSASGGDYGPAIVMANYGNVNAIVMGDTSRGLGMPVFRSIESLPGSEMFTRNPYAFSLLPNGLPLENVGPVPQLRREVFFIDLANGFSQYALDILKAGIDLASGLPLNQMQDNVKQSVNKMLTGGVELPEIVMEAISFTKELEELVVILETTKKGRESAALLYIELYQELNDILDDMARDGLESYGMLLEIPLPEDLIAHDILLAGQYRSRSVVDRLEMLQRHSKFKSMPQTQKLLKVLAETFSIVENAAAKTDCNTLFRALPNFDVK